MVFSNILIRSTNWVGDAVMSLGALRTVRELYPAARISVLAKPGVADIFRGESGVDEVILYEKGHSYWRIASDLRRRRFDCALLFQNAFEAAWITWLARIPNRIGYDRDGRGFLLTTAVPVPKRGEIPRHERFYYLELLRRAGLLGKLEWRGAIRLRERGPAKRVIGVSPGAAYGTAKRWLPERFAEAAAQIAKARGCSVALFGSKDEQELCEEVAARMGPGLAVTNFAGKTSLGEFINLAAECDLFLTNDSGAMHIASALGVPTVAVFGATDDIATGPVGDHTRVVREPVECSPCLLRECPIDHRCMTRVSTGAVVAAALELLG